MRKILITLVIVALGAGCEAVDVSTTEGTTTSLPSAAPASSAGPTAPGGSLAEQIASLKVADDDRDGYDRDDFGDYDRDTLLEASLDEHDCYYSAADDKCYDDPSAVHADHIVALAEAWRSGLAESDTDAIAEDPDNLWLLTASENMSKSDDDPAAWLPDNGVCTYIAAYVEVKIEYELTVDQAEHNALTEAATTC